MIRLENVSKSYGGKLAVDNLSFEVAKGEVCILIGPSGCGKTTTLRMINRLIEPTSGRIFINGEDASQSRPEVLRRSIGYAIQSVGLFPHMTVAENIGVVPRLLGWNKVRIRDRVDMLLDLVGLNSAAYTGKYSAQLSGGESQRVGVARALAADPPILLMDEPFGAVDPLTRERLQSQFARIQQKLRKTVILVTHDLDEAIRLADRLAIMKAGKLVQYGTPEQILSSPVDRFVHDFVGADRALKRLSRISVSRFVKKVRCVKSSASLSEVAGFHSCRWVWVVDDNGLVGWIDRGHLSKDGNLKDAIVPTTSADAIGENATLREALSRMLGQGIEALPVIDEAGRFVGEVTLRDVEAATMESEVTT